MNLPFFYAEGISAKDPVVILNEETSKHIAQVLRMKASAQLRLTDGLGNLFTGEIIKEHRKATEVKMLSAVYNSPSPLKATIAISLIKNTTRFEWFLEKATELGINAIIPLICERTEKQHFRYDRMKNILVSAMLQSQQSWLPFLSEPVRLQKFIESDSSEIKMIAHCMDGTKKLPTVEIKNSSASILIGPEGDFSPVELDKALAKNYQPVTLGNSRLRAETAGLAAAVLMKISAGH